jgi:hypothetical protein
MALNLLLRQGATHCLNDTQAKPKEEIAREILSYFLRNPDAADSFDGIARWRLLEDIVRRSVTATEEGLKWLIEQGYLKQEPVPGGKPIFSLNAAKRKDAEHFVTGHGDAKDKKQ